MAVPDFIRESLEFQVDQWCIDTGANARAALHMTLAFIERQGLKDQYEKYLEEQKRMCLKLHPPHG